jgi:triosephosphate isomerase
MLMNRPLIDSFLKMYAMEPSTVNQHGEIVVCPSFCFLDFVDTQKAMIADNALKLGAQDCSQFIEGAYTGEVAATYLKDVGCQYGIVGHPERRKLFHENDHIVLAKAKNLLANGITPIICIGSTENQLNVADECTYITKQINFFLRNFEKKDIFIFAYEPSHAIGTNVVPAIQSIKEIASIIKMIICNFDFEKKSLILYGGSVDENSIKSLKTVHEIDGFLIGRASIDFQKLKNIISY